MDALDPVRHDALMLRCDSGADGNRRRDKRLGGLSATGSERRLTLLDTPPRGHILNCKGLSLYEVGVPLLSDLADHLDAVYGSLQASPRADVLEQMLDQIASAGFEARLDAAIRAAHNAPNVEELRRRVRTRFGEIARLCERRSKTVDNGRAWMQNLGAAGGLGLIGSGITATIVSASALVAVPVLVGAAVLVLSVGGSHILSTESVPYAQLSRAASTLEGRS